MNNSRAYSQQTRTPKGFTMPFKNGIYGRKAFKINNLTVTSSAIFFHPSSNNTTLIPPYRVDS